MKAALKVVGALAIVLIGLSIANFAFRGAESDGPVHGVPLGVWAGTYTVGERIGFVRVDFSASLSGDQSGSPDIVRLARTDLVNIEVDAAYVRFGLPGPAETLGFVGTWDDSVIQGQVEGPDGHGTFVLHREVPLELDDYVPLLGSYRLEEWSEGNSPGEVTARPEDDLVHATGSRTILIMNGRAERSWPGYFEDDRFVTMFPIATNMFISELGEWLLFDPDSLDQPMRLHTQNGNVYVGVQSDAYREETVEFANDNVRLAGSLFIPSGKDPFPAVVLIHGSQGDDRHPYRHYADHFARQGIASLIYDKRGTGESSGNWRSAGMDVLTGDALAAVDFLKEHPEIDPQAIGVWGISQGGWIVALAAQQDPDIAFVIGVSAAGTTPGRQEAFRIRNVLEDQGLQGLGLELSLLWHRMLYPLGHLATKPYIPLPRALKNMAGGLAVSPFFDPVPVWREVHQPVLLVYGEVDFLVDPVQSPELITEALNEGGNASPTVVMFAAADHSIRVTETGRPSEVLRELRFAPGYFEAKSDWIWSVIGHAHAAAASDA